MFFRPGVERKRISKRHKMHCWSDLKLTVRHNWEFTKEALITQERKVFLLQIINIEQLIKIISIFYLF